jgi:hypothetical protein
VTIVNEGHPEIIEHTFDTGEVRLNYAEGPREWSAAGPLAWPGAAMADISSRDTRVSMRWHIFVPDLRGHGELAHFCARPARARRKGGWSDSK